MAIFGLAAIYIFFQSVTQAGYLMQDIAMIELLLIMICAILGQTLVLIRIYEQHA